MILDKQVYPMSKIYQIKMEWRININSVCCYYLGKKGALHYIPMNIYREFKLLRWYLNENVDDLTPTNDKYVN